MHFIYGAVCGAIAVGAIWLFLHTAEWRKLHAKIDAISTKLGLEIKPSGKGA